MIRRLVFYAIAVCLLANALPAADDPWDSGCEMVGLSSGGSIFQPSCSPHDPRILTVATDMGGSFITCDGGATWHTIHFEQLSGSISASATFHPKDPQMIYWVKGGCELRVTHDQGVHWAHVGTAQPWGDSQIIRIWLDPDYPDRIFVGTELKTFLSKDEGKSWAECAGVPGYLYRVVAGHGSPADKRVYLIGTSTGCYRSDDNGATFTKKVQGLSSDKLAGFAGGSNAKETMLYAAVSCELKDGKLTGGMFCSRDRGETWENCMTEGINRETKKGDEFGIGELPQYGWMACADKMPERAYVFCSGTSFRPPNHATIYRTDNAGKSWCAVLFSDPRFKGKGFDCNVETDWQTECWGQREQGGHARHRDQRGQSGYGGP